MAAFTGGEVFQVVSSGPKLVVVPGYAVESIGHLFVSDVAVAVIASFRIAAMDVVVEVVNVFAQEAKRVPDQSIRAVIVIGRRIWRYGDDYFEAVDSGGRGGQCQGPGMRRARHAHLSRRPERIDRFIAIGRRVSGSTSIEPVNHGLGSKRFIIAADRRASLRKSSSRR